MRISSETVQLAAASAALLAGLAFTVPALAQSNQQQGQVTQYGPRVKNLQQPGAAPPAQTIATYGAWKVQCEDLPAPKAADGSQPPPQKQCAMVQDASNDKNPQAKLSLVVVKSKQGDKTVTMMRVLAPIAVYLPTGVALEIDGTAVGRVPFMRCLPQVCIAFAEVSPETMSKLKKGKEANFIVYEAPGISVPMKLALPGFDKGLASLDKL